MVVTGGGRWGRRPRWVLRVSNGVIMGIHPTAIIEHGARIHATAEVGPYCVVASGVTIAEGTTLVAHVTVSGRTRLGARNLIQPFAVVGGEPQDLSYRGEKSEVFVGDDNLIETGVTINGGTSKGGHRTVVGHRNRFGACSHVAHDCVVENDCLFGDSCLLAGHVRVESGAAMGSKSAVHHFATIGRLARIGTCAGISRDAPPFMRTEGYGSVIGVNSTGLAESGISSERIKILSEIHHIIWREQLPKPEALLIVERNWGSDELVREVVDFLRASDLGRMGRRRDPSSRPAKPAGP